MRTRTRFGAAIATCLVAALGISGAAQQTEEKKEQKKLDKQARQDFDALVAAVDSVVGGQPAPTAIDMAWAQNHFIKAQQNKAYIPFTLSFDPATITTSQLALYVRLVSRGGAAPAAAADEKDKKPEKPNPATFAWENVHFFDAPKAASDATAGTRALVSRAFTAEAGDYDLYLAVRERTGGKKGVTPKTTVIKQPLTIPNFYDNELTTSSVILAAKADALNTPLPADQQLDNAYTLGTMRLTPSIDNKFTKAGELNVYFWIYNPTVDATKKPDVSVEYAFHQKTGETEKYFNKTNPLRLNGQSLQPDFDMEAGHQLNGGQSIRLAVFPEGEYRLEIKVTDNLSKKSVSRDIKFTVST